ncbi:hypothetical protein QBC38DRAFT_447717 [Podospora fimiseda]|uniref:BTB domain-containing protein n=1 Tax=Podospora fimiseda TaxID=252190 RepID=A0AAN7BEP5_9PEZI|nr:hypothetical protein QBC38DRAFT_447717 [Podospora fimiseda]
MGKTQSSIFTSVDGSGHFASKFSGRVIKMLIGPEKKEWNIHESLLLDVSEFFIKTLKGSFKESKEGLIEFPEEEVGIFGHFVNWLYVKASGGLKHLGTAEIRNEAEMLVVLKVSIFANKYLITEFEDDLVRVLHPYFERINSGGVKVELIPDHYSLVFGNTPEGSKMQSLLADQCLVQVKTRWLEPDVQEQVLEAERTSPGLGLAIMKSLFKSGRMRSELRGVKFYLGQEEEKVDWKKKQAQVPRPIKKPKRARSSLQRFITSDSLL